MTKPQPFARPGRSIGGWILAIAAIAIWLLLASQSAEAQEVRIPDIVLAQVLGHVPPPPAPSVAPAEAAPVNLVAHRMHRELEDQLVAGVARPNVDLRVHFEWDSAEILEDSTPEIEAAAEVLKRHFPSTRFRLAGFTDKTGDAAYNQTLSERRAAAVWTSLVEEHGVSAARLEAVGFGEEDPDAEADDAERRRVELQIMRDESFGF